MTKYKLRQELLVINETIEIPDGAIGINVDMGRGESLRDCYCTTVTYLEPVK